MVEGMIAIHVDGIGEPAVSKVYRLRFFPRQPAEHAALNQKFLVGEPALKDYIRTLYDPSMSDERRGYWANKWMDELRGSQSISKENVWLTERQFDEFR
jgi:hypothetical protein